MEVSYGVGAVVTQAGFLQVPHSNRCRREEGLLNVNNAL